MTEDSPQLRRVEDWAAEKATPDWLFAAAKTGNRWPIGKVLSAPDFEAAVHRAAHTTAG